MFGHEVVIRSHPVSVWPHDVRFVLLHQLIQLRHGFTLQFTLRFYSLYFYSTIQFTLCFYSLSFYSAIHTVLLLCNSHCAFTHLAFTRQFTLYFYSAIRTVLLLIVLLLCNSRCTFTWQFTLYFYSAIHTVLLLNVLLLCNLRCTFTWQFTLYFYSAIHTVLLLTVLSLCNSHCTFTLQFTLVLLLHFTLGFTLYQELDFDLFNTVTLVNESIEWDNEFINCVIKYMSTNYPLFLTYMCDHQQSPWIESNSTQVSDNSVSSSNRNVFVVILMLYNPWIFHFAHWRMCCYESECF